MKAGVKMGVMNYLWILIFHNITASYLKQKAGHLRCCRESILGEVELSEPEGFPNSVCGFQDIVV